MKVLDGDTLNRLAAWVDDRVDCVIPYFALRSGRCEAWLAGTVGDVAALVVLDVRTPGEPWAFGPDAEAALPLLAASGHWTYVNVAPGFADAMADALTRATGRGVTRYGDLYFAQRRPQPVIAHPCVRALTVADASLLASAQEGVRPDRPEHVERLLEEGFCTAAVIDAQIVAQTHSYYITPRYADIGAATAPAYRGRGLSPACASLLCARLHERGRIPVWSTGETNAASQRVAAKVGFIRVAERAYLSLI